MHYRCGGVFVLSGHYGGGSKRIVVEINRLEKIFGSEIPMEMLHFIVRLIIS